MYTKLLSAILFLCIWTSLEAQDDCGCKEAERLRAPMGLQFNSGRLDSAEYYTSQLLGFREKGCQIFYESWMGQIALGRKDLAGARVHLDKEKKLLKVNACNPELYVRYYSTLSRLYQELNLSDSFVIACLNGIDAAARAGDQYGLSRACTDVASAFSQMGQGVKAMYYYRLGLDAAVKQSKVPSLKATVQTRLATELLYLFDKTNNRMYADSASLIAHEALETAGKYKDLLAFQEANEVLAKHALRMKSWDSALQYAAALIEQSPPGIHLFDRFIYSGYAGRSEAYLGLKDFAKAEAFADSALLYATVFNPQMMVGAYENIYKTARLNQHPAKSLDAFEKMVSLRDSLFGIEKNKAVTELEKKYTQVKNENTIRELDRKKQFYLLLAISALLAVLAIAYFVRHQSLKHRQLLLEAEQRLNRARMNPHFFFNSLSALQKFALIENNPQAMASNLSRFSYLMRQTLESTYKEYVTIEEEMEYLMEYVKVQDLRLQTNFSYSITAETELEISESIIPPMIIQPFIENSIEHGLVGLNRTAQLSVHFGQEKDMLRIEITDNGKGLPGDGEMKGEHISRATQIIKDRILLLNSKLKKKASFSVSNNDNTEGVKVIINLPLIWKNELNRKS
jgi:hypothetical protein